jgi:hypothetical protein
MVYGTVYFTKLENCVLTELIRITPIENYFKVLVVSVVKRRYLLNTQLKRGSAIKEQNCLSAEDSPSHTTHIDQILWPSPGVSLSFPP